MRADLELDVGQRNSRFPELNLAMGQRGQQTRWGPGIWGGGGAQQEALLDRAEMLFSQR